jgi:hypothetical protein
MELRSAWLYQALRLPSRDLVGVHIERPVRWYYTLLD